LIVCLGQEVGERRRYDYSGRETHDRVQAVTQAQNGRAAQQRGEERNDGEDCGKHRSAKRRLLIAGRAVIIRSSVLTVEDGDNLKSSLSNPV
jgi:hypothetical protein